MFSGPSLPNLRPPPHITANPALGAERRTFMRPLPQPRVKKKKNPKKNLRESLFTILAKQNVVILFRFNEFFPVILVHHLCVCT